MKVQAAWKSVIAHRFMYGGMMTFARGLPVLALLLASIMLSGDSFGRISVVVTALATASLLSDSGMDAAATWLLGGANKTTSPARTISALIALRIVVSTIVVLVLIAPQAGALSGNGSGALLLLVCAIAAAAMAYCSAMRISLRVSGAGEVRALLAEKLVGGVLFLLAIFVLGGGLADRVWIYPATCLLGCLVVMLWQRVALVGFGVDVVRKLLESAAPFVVTTMCAAIVWRLPVFIVGANGDYEAAGFLALASYPILLLSSVSVLSAPLLFLRRGQRAQRAIDIGSTVAMGLVCTFSIWLACGVIEYFEISLPIDERVLLVVAVFAPVLLPLWLNPQISAWLRLNHSPWLPTLPAVVGAVVGVLVMALSLRGAISAVVGILAAEYAALAFYLVLRVRWMKNEPSGVKG